MLDSSFAIASAQIRHRRFQPKSHEFSTDLKYLWFDPEQLSDLLSQSKLCSERHWSLLNLYPEDFLTEQSGSIREKIKRIILQQTDSILPSHTNIRILALPRSLGFRFNSVVFYFIFDAQQQPLFILSEITNTLGMSVRCMCMIVGYRLNSVQIFKVINLTLKNLSMFHLSCRCSLIIAGDFIFQCSST